MAFYYDEPPRRRGFLDGLFAGDDYGYEDDYDLVYRRQVIEEPEMEMMCPPPMVDYCMGPPMGPPCPPPGPGRCMEQSYDCYGDSNTRNCGWCGSWRCNGTCPRPCKKCGEKGCKGDCPEPCLGCGKRGCTYCPLRPCDGCGRRGCNGGCICKGCGQIGCNGGCGVPKREIERCRPRRCPRNLPVPKPRGPGCPLHGDRPVGKACPCRR